MAFLITACSPSANHDNYYANLAYHQADYADALKGYQRAQVNSPDEMIYYFNGALAYAEMGQFNQALSAMQFALKYMDTGNANVYYNLGNIYAQTRNYQAAISAYQEGLKLDSAHESMRHNLEVVLLMMAETPMVQTDSPPPLPDENEGDGVPNAGHLTFEQALALLEQIEQNQGAWRHFNLQPDVDAYHDGDAW